MFQLGLDKGSKNWESYGMFKNTCLEHSTGKQVIALLITYERGILEKAQSLTSRDGAWFTTVWNTWLYKGY